MKEVKLWGKPFGCQESRMYITVDKWGFACLVFFLFPPAKHFYYNTGDLNLLVL